MEKNRQSLFSPTTGERVVTRTKQQADDLKAQGWTPKRSKEFFTNWKDQL